MILIPWFAFWNSARGRKLFGLTDSTVISRLVSTAMMAMAVADNHPLLQFITLFLFTLLGLMVWCTPAWDEYWSAEIGNDLIHSRWWGLWNMGIRMVYMAPCVIGVAFLSQHPWCALYALGTPLLALPYWLFGWFVPKKYVIFVSELAVGAMVGFILYLAI